MGASVALAGLTACTEKPVERILAYTKTPEGMVPGQPLPLRHGPASRTGSPWASWPPAGRAARSRWRATPAIRCPAAPPARTSRPSWPTSTIPSAPGCSRNGAPAAAGAASARRCASGRRPGRRTAAPGSGSSSARAARSSPARCARPSPSAFPRPGSTPGARRRATRCTTATALAFGKPLEPHYVVEKADVLLSLDADFLEARNDTVDQNLGFANRREPNHPSGLNRLYVVEPRFSITGGMADHRLKLRSADIEGFTLALAAELGKALPALSGFRSPSPLGDDAAKFVAAVAKDLAGKRGAALVIPGERQTALTHAVAHAINAALGAVGTTVTFTEPAVLDTATGRSSWQSLVDELRAGKVDTLVITAWNPVFTAPGDVDLPTLLAKVAQRGLPRAARRRDVAARELVPSRGASLRELGRRPLPRGHAVHRPAAHPAALRRDLRGRAARGVRHRRGQALRAAEDPPRLAGEDRLRQRVGGVAVERRGARHREPGGDPVAAGGPGARRRRTGEARAGRPRAGRGARLQDPRRPLFAEQLAPGAAGPDHQGDLGQRGAGRPRAGQADGGGERGPPPPHRLRALGGGCRPGCSPATPTTR